MAKAGKRDKFEEEWQAELERDLPPDETLRDYYRRAQQAAKQAGQKSATLTQQLDQLGQYAIRDLPRDLGEGLERHFPDTAAALPKARWKQVGWTLAGLAGVYWLVGLGPELAQSLVWLGGIGVVGYTGWNVLTHWRRTHRDETAKRFSQLAAELSGAAVETDRIAALAALDQLGYDNPRYRLALVSLLQSWLTGRSEGHDVAVAVQMVAEFRGMLAEAVADSEDDEPARDGVMLAEDKAELAPVAAATAPLEVIPPEATIEELRSEVESHEATEPNIATTAQREISS